MDKRSVESRTIQSDLHLGSSFLPHPVPPPEDWFDYHPTYCAPSGGSSTPGSSTHTPLCDTMDGVPCLVPRTVVQNSPEAKQGCTDHPHGCVPFWPDQYNGSPVIYPEMSPMTMYPSDYGYHRMDPAYFAPVPCVPNLNQTPTAEELWNTVQCVPGSESSSQETEVNMMNESELLVNGHENEETQGHTEQSANGDKLLHMQGRRERRYYGTNDASAKDQYPQKKSFTRRIRNPDVLPVVDLTKSEMEIFTLQDFKEKKLDYLQKKTQDDKSTVLVVCIDHGMCAAFYLPQEDLHDEENENEKVTKPKIPHSVIPPSLNKAKGYRLVKKSQGVPATVASSEKQGLSIDFDTRYSNSICRDTSELETAVRNIPRLTDSSDSE